MAQYLTSNSLIASVKRRAMIPNNQSTFTNADFLALANDEMQIGLVPKIISIHEEYFVWLTTVPLVPNTSRYPIPERAIGGKLRDLFYKDLGGTLHEMTRVSPNDKAYYQTSHLQNRYIAYYIEGNEIVITPAVGANPTGSLLFTYFLRPNELVEESNVAIITAMTANLDGTTTFTVNKVPTGMSTSTLVDLVQTKPGHRMLKFDITPASIVGTTSINLTTSDLVNPSSEPLNISIGDQIAFAGQCIVPMIPTDLHSILAQRVAARCVEALGDQQGLAAANNKLGEMEEKAEKLINNRVDGSPLKVTNFGGLLRTSRIRRRGWI